MESIQWYLQRLRVMSLREIAHRTGERALLHHFRLARALRARQERVVDWPRYAFCTAAACQLPRLQVAFNPTAQEVQQILTGDWGALGFPWQWRVDANVWRRAPDTARLWPGDFFGTIAYRAGNPYGDARVLWEPARLQGLVSLALLSDHDPNLQARAVELLEQVLASFTRDNPPLAGAHYLSAMECALRLIAVCHALDMMRGALQQGATTWSRLLCLIESHASFIERRLSRHSAAGNHSIAECAGLVYAGLLFPEHPRAALWRSLGLELLAEQVAWQVMPDGGGIEQAVWYHLFVVDLLGLVEALLRARGERVPLPISAALARGRAFLCALGDSPEKLPPIGDGDGGFALTSHLRISFASCERRPTEVVTFAHAGYTVCRPSAAPGLRVVIDHGPLGMAPSFGHGHADALSVTVTADGADLLIDPGTYGYNQGAAWRRYFRSTRAHNTVTVDGQDQAEQESTFMWSRPYSAQVVESSGATHDRAAQILMRHDGYRTLGVIHWRAVLIKKNGLIVVWDRLEGHGEHEFELNWHLGSESTNTGPADSMRLGSDHRMVVQGGRPSLHSGETDPPRGWRSQRYAVLSASVTLRTVWRGPAPHEFATFVVPNSMDVDLQSELDQLRSMRAC